MELWLVYGLIAALAFGLNAIVYKLGFKNGFNPFVAGLVFSLGVLLVFIAAILIKKPEISLQPGSTALILISGVIWAIGFLAVTLGIAQNFDISKMAIAYNSNVIVTVILGIVVLKEMTSGSDLIRTLIGMGLVAAGIVITSLK